MSASSSPFTMSRTAVAKNKREEAALRMYCVFLPKQPTRTSPFKIVTRAEADVLLNERYATRISKYQLRLVEAEFPRIHDRSCVMGPSEMEGVADGDRILKEILHAFTPVGQFCPLIQAI